jgi:hypothetical protein
LVGEKDENTRSGEREREGEKERGSKPASGRIEGEQSGVAW